MLITTGKKPDVSTRRIANALFASIPHSCIENRGSRTLSALISKAKKKRMERLCSIHMGGGKPASITFLSLEGSGWARLFPRIKITKVAKVLSAGRKQHSQSGSLAVKGAKKSALLRLIGSSAPTDESGEPESSIIAGAKKLEIKLGKKTIISLGVSYESS